MTKNNPSIITFFAILYISLVPMMGFYVFAQENAPASSEAVPEAEVAADTDEEEEGFDDEFEDEFGDAEKEVFDPLSGYNRVMTDFNDSLYVWVLDPVARGIGGFFRMRHDVV